jgi:hypothetical protein
LIELVGQFVIDEIFGEIHAMKLDFEVVDELEVLILATVTQKVVLDNLHFLFLLRDQFLKSPVSGFGFLPCLCHFYNTFLRT